MRLHYWWTTVHKQCVCIHIVEQKITATCMLDKLKKGSMAVPCSQQLVDDPLPFKMLYINHYTDLKKQRNIGVHVLKR